MASKKDNVVLPKELQDKGAVIAFKAKDASVHASELDRDIYDADIDYKITFEKVADQAQSLAPYVDDWNAHAVSGSDQFKVLLADLMDHPLFDQLLTQRRILAQLIQKKARS